jgi:integrase
MGNLTKTQIDKLVGKTHNKQLELSDGDNLYLFVTKNGKCRFKFRVRKNNQATWIVIGEYPYITLNEARDKASEHRKSLAKGEDINLAKRQQLSKQITVEQLVERYYKEKLHLVRTKEQSRNNFISVVKSNIVNIIGNMLISDITKDVIQNKLIKPKLDNKTPSAARNNLTNIKLLLDFAIELEIIVDNPTSKIKASNICKVKQRERFLDANELKQFLNLVYEAPMKTQHKFAFHLLLLMLNRKFELISATWENVDFEQKIFIVNQSKTNTQLVIPLPHQAITIFRKLKELAQDSKFIFNGRSMGLAHISKTTLNYMLIPINQAMFGDNKKKYFTVHDLRRTSTTHLSEMGNPSDYIEVALNHKKPGIKQVYQRSTFIKQRKEMIQEWADKLDSLIKPDLLPYNKDFYI